MDKHLLLTSAFVINIVCSAAMASPVTVPAGQFPDFDNGEYMQPNTIYKNAAIANNMDGVSEGIVWANARYEEGAYCQSGTYLPMSSTVCETCPENHFCVGGAFEKTDADQGITACPEGTMSLPGADTCMPDPLEGRVMCAAGTYLPAFAGTCATCPENYFCDGGVFERSDADQGITRCLNGQVSLAGSTSESQCRPWNIVCPAGTYLPANTRACETCLAGSYCGGDGVIRIYRDSYIDQGISTCPEGLTSPLGASSPGECGKELHVGDDVLYLTSVKQTSPALAVSIDGTVYYANMTKVSEGVKPMSYLTNRSMRTIIDGKEYSIHDNTIKEEQ